MKLRAQQSARSHLIIMDLCLKKTQVWKSHVYRDVIVCEKFRSQNVFHPHNKTKQNGVFKFCSLKKFRKVPFCRGELVWLVGLTVEINMR